MFWLSPMLTTILSKIGSSEVSDVGMSIPHWNMYWSSPVVFRQTDLPPALGPEMRSMRFFSLRLMVSGTILRPSDLSAFSRRGCLALRRDRLPSLEIIGIPAIMSRAV